MICWPTAQLVAAAQLYFDKHAEAPFHDGSFERWSKERSADFPFHMEDGVTFWLSPVELSPGDDWLGGSVAQDALDDDAESGNR